MIYLEPKLERIGNALMVCDCCGWEGTVDECIPDVDGDGALGCQVCAANNNIGDDLHEKVLRFELTFRRGSNQDIQVLLNDQFLLQFHHQATWPLEMELAESMQMVMGGIERMSMAGKSASEAAKEFQKIVREDGNL